MRIPNIYDNRGPTRHFGFIPTSVEAAGFDFDTISGLALDLNPVASKVTATADGDPLETLTDSKNSKEFTQATFSKRPLWNESDADFNSQPSITFDGFDDFLALAEGFLAGNVGSIFTVLKPDNSAATQTVISTSDQTFNTWYLRKQFPSSADYMQVESRQGGSPTQVRGSTTITNVPYITTLLSDSTQWIMYINSADETEVIISHGNTGDWFDDIDNRDIVTFGGCKHNAEVESFQGKIARCLVYDARAITFDELNTIEAELSTLYGISI
jgi:hypothetical protein